MTTFFFSESYKSSLSKIEDFIFEQTRDVALVDQFLTEHDKALQFISENPTTPAIHPATGDQSWIFSSGRYRFFFTVSKRGNNLEIYLIHIIDNRQANLEIYPNNSMPTYSEE